MIIFLCVVGCGGSLVKFGGLRLTHTPAAMLGPWASPSLTVACSASVCQLRHSINVVVWSVSE